MNINTWNQKTYQEYLTYLNSLANPKYQAFQSSLCQTKYPMLGINLPTLRRLAKQISKTNYEEYFTYVTDTYYEEVLIEGLVLANIKDEKIFAKYFNNYLKKIDNWAICDSFCNSLHIVSTNPNKYFKIALKLAHSSKEFISRTGLIIILNFFIKEEYLNDIFNLLDNITSDKYYINMAEAWLICELYIYYEQETTTYLKNNHLNKFTHNKAISKIRESYRVSQEQKEYLNTLKRT